MKQTGTWNQAYGLDKIGLTDLAAVYWNLSEAELYEESIRRGESRIAAGGALVVETGQHTGRSAQDKFVVREAATEDQVWWDNNKPISREHFENLRADFIEAAKGKEFFVQDLVGGADEKLCLPARIITRYAWHSLFVRNLLIRPERAKLASFVPQFTIIDIPEFRADKVRHGARSETIIACDLENMLILIGGSGYGGEMKKSVFTALNYLLPKSGVMPMHCSANIGPDGDVAVFFGLSGTGKTTLSADASRTLIGDDEHGWGPNGVFNFEGGCYAKTIRLSKEAEPEIYATTQRWGTVLENVVLDPVTRVPDLDSDKLTENTRAGYPLHFIPNASETGWGGQPKNIIFLTADAFGVLPPIAKLTPEQAVYHFLSGYTAKVAGTERGITEPQATFSTCFGGPFMPRHPSVYGDLLREHIAKYGVDCWLVNTGWTGGAYGTGHRMPIKVTRALLAAALDGSLKNATFYTDKYFGFEVPTEVHNIDSKLLYPVKTWADAEAFGAQATKLVNLFIKNFEKFEKNVDQNILAAAPAVKVAAE